MPAKKGSRINLLPQEEFETSTLGRVLVWTLSSFRIIVIVTEMVVMFSFLSRFWLDARNSDLNDEIRQKQAVILAQGPFEKEFKAIQTKLKIFSALSSPELSVSEISRVITSYLPPDVLLTNFSIGQDSFQLKGVSANERAIAQFISNLESSGKFSEVSLAGAEVDAQDKTSLIFTLSLTPKKGGGG